MIRIERRLQPSRLASWTGLAIGVLSALISGGLIVWIAGANPVDTYLAMLNGALGNFAEVVVKAIPLILCALSVALAAKTGFWNIGAEGQLVSGGIGAAGVALFIPKLWPSIPGGMLISLMIAGGVVSGAICGLTSTIPKVKIGANEILLTLFTNYLAIRLVEFLYYGPWRDPEGRGFPGTALFMRGAWFPRLGNTRVHFGLLFALILPMMVWLLLKFTKLGYEVAVVGKSKGTAKYAGINIAKVTVIIMLISAGMAGIAGAGEVGGILHRLHQGLAMGYGYTGIIIAWLAGLNPWQIMVVSLLLAGLLVGGDQVQISMGLPASVGLAIQGLILLWILASPFLARHRIRAKWR